MNEFASVLAWLGLAGAVVAALFVWGRWRWAVGTRSLRARIERGRQPIAPAHFDAAELASLPAPVRRYLAAALRPGQPIVLAVSLQQEGTLNLGETSDQWRPFRATQRVLTRRPGFDWDARVRVLPGFAMHVHDAYVAGQGLLQVSAWGLLDRAKLEGAGEVARGELLRFLAEAPWYPTALLPSQGARWHAVDDASASVTLTDGEVSATLMFRFGQDGLVEGISAMDRGRQVGQRMVPTRWQGRFWNYAVREGMRVPLDGEVAWLTPAVRHTYWRGHVTQMVFEFAPAVSPA